MSENYSVAMRLLLKKSSYADQESYDLKVDFGYFRDKNFYFFSDSDIYGEQSSFRDLILEKWGIRDERFLIPLFEEVYCSQLELKYDFNYRQVTLESIKLMSKRLTQLDKVLQRTNQEILSQKESSSVDSCINYYAKMLYAIAQSLKVAQLYFPAQDKHESSLIVEFGRNGDKDIRGWLANSMDVYYHLSNGWRRILRYTTAPKDYEIDLAGVETVQEFRESMSIPNYRGILIPVEMLTLQETEYRKNGIELLSEMALRLKLNKLQESHLFYKNADRVSLAEAAYREFLVGLTNYHATSSSTGWKSYGAYELCQIVCFKSSKYPGSSLQAKVSAIFSQYHDQTQPVVTIKTDKDIN